MPERKPYVEAQLEYIRQLDTYTEKTAPYIEYLMCNFDDMCDAVNEVFEGKRAEVAGILSGLLAKELGDGDLEHFEWYQDGCDWDDSGDVRERGTVDLNQTVGDFLADELTGAWMPTFESHHGKRFGTYSESFECDTLDLGFEILIGAIRQLLSKEFPEEDWDKNGLISDIMDTVQDPFFDNTHAGRFFDADSAFDFAGLSDKPLSEFVAHTKSAER